MQAAPVPTSEDKVMAATAHFAGLLGFLGPIATILIFLTQRPRSAYVRFQALQSLSYQILYGWAGISIGLVAAIAQVLFILPEQVRMAQVPMYIQPDPGEQLRRLLAVVLPTLVVMGAYVLLVLIACVASLMGREFRHPFFGNALARKVGYPPTEAAPINEQEEQVLAAAGHSMALSPLLGLVAPLLLWLWDKRRSSFLNIQAAQATIYQALGSAAYLMTLGLMFVGALAGIGVLAVVQPTPSSGNGPALLAAALIFVPILCGLIILYVGGPLYHLFAFIAALATLRGRDYRYPILGRILSRRIGPKAEAA